MLSLLVALVALALAASGRMTGRQTITPHDYQSLGSYLAQSAPSCGFPYVTLDISRITAVQLMSVAGGECGTCLRVEAPMSSYIEFGETVGLPAVAMATHFESTTTEFPQLPLATVAKRQISEKVRYTYVLAVDTGGRGLDMAQVAFTALFGQSLSPMPAAWFPVDPKFCQDIWRNSTSEQLQNPTAMRSVPIHTGYSQAPIGLSAAGPIAGEEHSGSWSARSSSSLALVLTAIASFAVAFQ
ncbi:hypothetical protein GGH95_001605 [Coemansia sp. RSA 1836]|nr:hypothetical protein IWW47_003247 [Coemansia sp. RSA 2052]KAJ2582311.1 hypothetical protein GGH95_001605 [Coemansia sp. RSA 1836]